MIYLCKMMSNLLHISNKANENINQKNSNNNKRYTHLGPNRFKDAHMNFVSQKNTRNNNDDRSISVYIFIFAPKIKIPLNFICCVVQFRTRTK